MEIFGIQSSLFFNQGIIYLHSKLTHIIIKGPHTLVFNSNSNLAVIDLPVPEKQGLQAVERRTTSVLFYNFRNKITEP